MTVEGSQDISGLLAAWSQGDEEALRDLVSAVYPELRRLARQHLRRRPLSLHKWPPALFMQPLLLHGDVQGLRASDASQIERQRHEIVVRHCGNDNIELIQSNKVWRQSEV